MKGLSMGTSRRAAGAALLMTLSGLAAGALRGSHPFGEHQVGTRGQGPDGARLWRRARRQGSPCPSATIAPARPSRSASGATRPSLSSADEDDQAIHVVDVDGNVELSSYDLDAVPGQLLLAKDGRLFVALRSENRVAVLHADADGKTLRPGCSIRSGGGARRARDDPRRPDIARHERLGREALRIRRGGF